MANDPATAVDFGIVRHIPRKIVEVDDISKRLEVVGTGRYRAQIVASSKGVAGIDAYPDTVFIVEPIDNHRQLFKMKAQIAALAGDIFDDGGNALGFLQRRLIESACVLGIRLLRSAVMATWMKAEQAET